MAKYGQAFKDKVVARLLPPESALVEDVAQETRVNVGTLERWRSELLSRLARGRAWTAASRLDAGLTTTALDETSRSAWHRKNGVYPQELVAWRDAAPRRWPTRRTCVPRLGK
ncbi:MAG: hypothetical protein VB142_12320 [Burkholderia sp.]